MPKINPSGKTNQSGIVFAVPQTDYNGNVPLAAIHELKQEAAGVMHGTVTLTLHIKDGHLYRYTTGHERSFVPGRPMTGSDC